MSGVNLLIENKFFYSVTFSLHFLIPAVFFVVLFKASLISEIIQNIQYKYGNDPDKMYEREVFIYNYVFV